MRYPVRAIVGATLLVGLALGAVALRVLPGLLAGEQQVSAATSPDGTWSVAVVGYPTFSGSYELVVEVHDARGVAVPGASFVVDLTRDLSKARRDHAVRFVDNTTANVGDRTLKKAGLWNSNGVR